MVARKGDGSHLLGVHVKSILKKEEESGWVGVEGKRENNKERERRKQRIRTLCAIAFPAAFSTIRGSMSDDERVDPRNPTFEKEAEREKGGGKKRLVKGTDTIRCPQKNALRCFATSRPGYR